jgi:hypothetical protein
VSQDNVEIVRALVDRWNGGDRAFGRLSDYLDPEIRLDSPLSSVTGEPYRGYTGIERWVRDLDDQFAEWIIGFDDIRQIGDRVLAIGTIKARGRASGATLEFAYGSVHELADDRRVARIQIYADAREALKAVGLEE